ncbi:class I SAM-dependent methyltransferase [Dyadobacter chenwenxiniae]|uniref:Class I SAM-dependent methyltransferase n=1 Tax=Dyadobacter chenwenxiniae TaxID=2906456 RepID=A0A9X1PQ33_9BACT|nr:class I SAM-dependent methyltransferase [Dyadobacter chenwenxiniae]MCF0064861.1 class I SAM-dependent methyltransferase [Dyadobacter chenwenxiniae]UON82984.1 class I SAM-dependent methyltransferase [Dyadobacter chenwenxiniae]
MNNNYDRTAGFYDKLSKLVFGDALMEAQRSVLHFIPEDAKILIAGGGTGAVLEEIARVRAQGVSITYVEISKKMIGVASKRSVGGNNVQFVNVAIESFKTDERFDVIITSFLFDNFRQDKAEAVFYALDNLLNPTGMWLFTDFNVEQNPNRIWQKWLLKSMYLFFKILSNVEANELPEMEMLLSNAGYKTIFKRLFYRNFVKSLVYQKP